MILVNVFLAYWKLYAQQKWATISILRWKNCQHLNATGEIAENCLGMIKSGFISLQEQGDKGVLRHGLDVTAWNRWTMGIKNAAIADGIFSAF